eukprot:scaffold203_cov386-Prasinococcus_capsulatus_cf.AAC.11
MPRGGPRTCARAGRKASPGASARPLRTHCVDAPLRATRLPLPPPPPPPRWRCRGGKLSWQVRSGRSGKGWGAALSGRSPVGEADARSPRAPRARPALPSAGPPEAESAFRRALTQQANPNSRVYRDPIRSRWCGAATGTRSNSRSRS